MQVLRRRLPLLLSGWLLFQLAGLLAPIAVTASGASAAEELCTCPGSEHGATCPMHHPGAPAPRTQDARNQAGRCVLQSASAPSDLALLSLATGGGLLSRVAVSFVSRTTVEPVPALVAGPSFQPRHPDSPPPRA